jgi:hypothetical protein
MGSKKQVKRESSVSAAIADACEELTSLGEECREVCDNMPESLHSGSRYEALDASASALECISEPDIDEDISTLCVATVTWTEVGGKRFSRADRCANAVAALQAAVEWLQGELDNEHDEDSDKHDALSSLIDGVQCVIDEAESCEFPGMYG